jgi:hypothetical protein
MTAIIARAALTPEDEALLASVRKALADLWADPVIVRHVAMSRSAARAIERHLCRLKIKNKNTAPRSSRQPTLVSGCEAHPAACDKRRGDRRQA